MTMQYDKFGNMVHVSAVNEYHGQLRVLLWVAYLTTLSVSTECLSRKGQYSGRS
jgi:hypothetical protein